MNRLHSFALAAVLCALLAAPADAKNPPASGKGSTAKSPSAGAPKGNPKCPPGEMAIGADTHDKAAAHVAKHFSPHGSYLVNDYVYNNFVKGKARLGRPQGDHSYLFVAGSTFISGVLKAAQKPDGTTDFTVIEHKLGLPAGTYKADGGLWRIDVDVKSGCYRMPKADDPGANSDFKAGGFTSGGVPEILVINGKLAKATNIVPVGPQKGSGGKGSGSKASPSGGSKKKGK
jgi:hypothetical protein